MSAPKRIHELDLLRGFFIFIIIIDHLQFWPSYLRFLTGEGRLWVSAAEGFFLISGLLIGYIRVYKGRSTPLLVLTKKLTSRAFMLYVWGIGISLFVTLFTLTVGNHELLPALPPSDVTSSFGSLLWGIVSGQHFNDWIYFLRLYAIMLLVTPLFLWLVRKKQLALVVGLMLGSYLLSFLIQEAALQWQLLFFGAALVGYKLEAIIDYFRKHRRVKKIFIASSLGVTIITVVASFFFVFGWDIVEVQGNPIMTRETYVELRQTIDPLFSNNPIMQPLRILLAFVWFSGLLVITHLLKKYVLRFLGWFLIPFGERSLSVYCLQALLLPIIVVVIPKSTDSIINTIIPLFVVFLFWVILKIPLMRKLLPV